MMMNNNTPGDTAPSTRVPFDQKSVTAGVRPESRLLRPPTQGTAPWVAKVEIYSRRFCADSMRTKGIFDRKHIQYNEYLIDDDIVNSSAMTQRSQGQHSTPQVFIDGNHVGGLQQVIQLEETGDLDFILGLSA